jgi:hypothetical protein
VTLPLTLPLVPVTVRVYDPTGVLDVVVTLRADVAVEPVPVKMGVVAGTNWAVDPLGRPLALRPTDPTKLPVLLKVTL